MAERPCTKARERPSALTRRASTISSSSSPTRSRRSASSGWSSNPGGSSNTPSTYASEAPGLTMPDRGLPPSSRSSAWASTVFPAPVSPVIAVSPSPGRSSARSIRSRFSMRNSSSTAQVYQRDPTERRPWLSGAASVGETAELLA